MSWNYTVFQINRSFDQIANWYHEFMHRAEQSFRALHERIMYLEERQAWRGPSDEQVERVLRKILAERFADAGVQRVENPNVMQDGAYFVQRPSQEASIPKPLSLDAASLEVDPNAVPSKTYGETFKHLENRLAHFPETDVSKGAQKDRIEDGTEDSDFKRPARPSSEHQTKRRS